jgi:signal transduction histidine kinase
VFITCTIAAQDQHIADSLTHIYAQNNLPDTAKLELLKDLSFNEITDNQKGLGYAEELIGLAEKTGNENYQRFGYFLKGTKLRSLGRPAEAVAAYFKSAEIAAKVNRRKGEAESYSAIGDTYAMVKNFDNAGTYYAKAIAILRSLGLHNSNDSISFASVILNAGDALLKTKRYDSSLRYSIEAKAIFDAANYEPGKAYSSGNMGMVYAALGKRELAAKYLTEAIRKLEKLQDYYPVSVYLLSLAELDLSKRDTAGAFAHMLKSLQLAEQNKLQEQISDASLKLSELYEQTGNSSEALKHYRQHIVYRDSINNLESVQKMADARFNYETAQTQKLINLTRKQQQNERNLRIYTSIILGLTLIILGVLIRNNRTKKKAFKVLSLQKQETERQKAKAEDALQELKITQRQLIQSAKMASLGELTAGIAHEIQNPLNFVNNFSDLSIELLEELKEEMTNKNTVVDNPNATLLIQNLSDNLFKVKSHGLRADSIVKGMLQHSRVSMGKKEPTNINALADEYLRLSYHGLKARRKEFSAKLFTLFDDSIGEVELVPQDIGRVLVNLFNNAFYAVSERQKAEGGTFEPSVTVVTKKTSGAILITIKDNGTGIPQHLIDKIFQPFFTTKPAGEGTGLGLSLSYDIIKAHGGELSVKTKEGEFSEFTIRLPVSNQVDSSFERKRESNLS